MSNTAITHRLALLILSGFLFAPYLLIAQWRSLSLPNPDRRFLNAIFFTDEANGCIAGNGIILKTADGGQSWQTVFTEPNNSQAHIWNAMVFIHPDTGFVVGRKLAAGVMLRSNDQGQHWTPVSFPTTAPLNDLFFVNRSVGVAVGDNGVILKTTNSGANWSVKPSGVNASLTAIFMLNDDTSYIVGSPDLVLKTVDGGDSWLSSSLINPTEVFFTSPSVGYAGFSDPAEVSIYKTTDGGVNWAYQLVAFGGAINSIVFTSAEVGYISSLNGIYRTENAGQSWVQETTQAAGAIHFLNSGKGYFISRDSLFIRESNPTGVSDEHETGLAGYELLPNYPNPFSTEQVAGNSTTTFRFAIPKQEHVTLKVYDVRGRLAATVVDEPMNAGEYAVPFAPRDLVSGIFFYSFTAGEFSQTKKAIFIR
jgi:hypothetical protein